MSPRLLALLATFACSSEGGFVVGSGVHGVRPAATGHIDVPAFAGAGPASTDGAADGGAKVISDGRARCYGGALSARAACVRTRGGSLAEDPGPTDYLETLEDQSRPWWINGKKKKKRTAGAAGSFYALESQRIKGSPSSSRKTYSRAAASGGEPLSPSGWATLLIVPLALLAGKLKEALYIDGSGRGAGLVKPKPTAAAKNATKTIHTPTKKAIASPAVAKRGRGKDDGGGGVVARAAGKLVPDNPFLRAVGIILLAVLGTGGLHALTCNNLLRAAWPITFVGPWQVLTATAWAINTKAVSAVGRLDGRRQASASRPPPVRFFTPADWAFAIWAPIFAGELIFVAFQLLPLPSIRGSWWLSDMSPWFAGSMLFQTLWCLSFRPWARDNGLLWLPALLLGGVAVALGGLHGILREAWFASDMTILQYLVIHVPLSLHFGWISCASLVNLNGYFASVAKLSNGFKLGASLFTVVAAVVLGVGITLVREDPIYGAVVAWALWAVGSPAGWGELRGRVDRRAIRAQQGAAKAGAVIAFATAASLVGLSIKDAIAGGGEFDEDY
eukprot:g5450.t1